MRKLLTASWRKYRLIKGRYTRRLTLRDNSKDIDVYKCGWHIASENQPPFISAQPSSQKRKNLCPIFFEKSPSSPTCAVLAPECLLCETFRSTDRNEYSQG